MTFRTTFLAAALATGFGAAVGLLPVSPAVAGTAVATPIRVASASWLDPSTGWVLGTSGCVEASCTTVAETTDSGATWTALAAPAARLAPSGSSGIDAIAVASADDAWAYYPQLHSTHDGGASWTRQPIPGGGTQVLSLVTAHGYAFAAVSTCVVGNPSRCTGPGSIWRTPVTSDEWTRLPVALPANGFPALSASSSTVYLTGARGSGAPYLLVSTDRATFASRAIPCQDPTVSSLRVAPAAPAAALLLCSENVGLGRFSKAAYGTVDAAGTTGYRGAADTDGQPVGLAARGRVGLIAVSGADSHLLRSLDGGRTWTRTYTGPSELLVDPQLVGSTGSVVSGPAYFPLAAGDLLLSHDGGLTWAVAPVVV